jgi:hypothetical protein
MNIFIDNNVWDQLFLRNVDLNIHFPKDQYSIFVTSEGVFEVAQIPPGAKKGLKKYIEKYIKDYVMEDSIFGFNDPNLPLDEQRVSGFEFGRFGSLVENEIRTKLVSEYGSTKKRKSSQILYSQEADIELATRSIDNIVLTLDKKKGPLKDAKELGGNVVFINLSEIEGLSADEFVNYIKIKISDLKT